MTLTIPRLFNKTKTFGNPYHGLNVGGALTLSNGSVMVSSPDLTKRRFGDCYEIRVPGHSYTDTQPFGAHLKFENYALNSGFESKHLHDYRFNYGDKRTWIYCDGTDRWLVSINQTPGGTATAVTVSITLTKFGDFYSEHEAYSYVLNAGNPAITTAFSGYKLELVNVNTNGNLAILGLCLETTATESQSTCIFDRQYGYPLAFIRLDISSKTTQTASIYRSKTYCERTVQLASTLLPKAYYWQPFTSKKIEQIKNPSNGAIIRTTNTFGEYKDYTLLNVSTGSYIKPSLNALPANSSTSELTVTWSWQPLNAPSAFGLYLGSLPNYPTGSEYVQYYRLIHVFIKDDNSLVDVECMYRSDNLSWRMQATKSKEVCLNQGAISTLASSLTNSISDSRIVITGDITSATGEAIIYIPEFSYQIGSGSESEYALAIGGSVKDTIKFKSISTTVIDSLTVTIPASGSSSTVPSGTYTNAENTYNGPTSGTITAVPLTSYKNYKGWMSKGTYTIDSTNFVMPFIQLYTNNLVGMVEGNSYTSNPDNAHWDTGSSGDLKAMSIYNKNGEIVNASQTITALTRYCSYHPVNNTFSGLYSVPVCYV